MENRNKRFQRNIEDLLKNEEFQERVQEVRDHLMLVDSLSGKEALEADEKTEPMVQQLSRDYNLAYIDDSPLYQLIHDGKITSYPKDVADLCLILPDWSRIHPLVTDDETGKQQEMEVTGDPEDDLEKYTRYQSYPVSIAISLDASKDDVLAYIKDHWQEIVRMRKEAGRPKQSRHRRQEERDRFIWENRDMSRKKLAELVRKQFNEASSFSEQHVNAIVRKLKKRHGEI